MANTVLYRVYEQPAELKLLKQAETAENCLMFWVSEYCKELLLKRLDSEDNFAKEN